ncbi:Cytochrome b561 and DOMON domain-containing protein [Neolecta irregularis DAH-3]|uniref:Cytochrome b561 and DOMON domain-containing protein n=1 Tax=Neolecta irregularis (strain DAH-3) TaxID=1198029 RepID=A0A1U7LVR8_NEOID|nr:Cytochrome b561 and DOMON domain-containing protein [Neolecta irregularis DAH-3]|eukprot:OLL26642.1 Cytochrome b561 and DOMON domain-containing protein [Neolecta irregularis DAH-3]
MPRLIFLYIHCTKPDTKKKPHSCSTQNYCFNRSATGMQFPKRYFAGICVAINVPSDLQAQGGLNLQITAPKDAGWAAVGIGKEMAGALMFVLYKNGENLTVSTRLGTSHNQPEQYNMANITVESGTGIINGRMVANIHCSNCNSWDHGNIDLTSNKQPFIWAMGVKAPSHPDSAAANIAQHVIRGSFTLNVAKAIGVGGIPSISGSSGPRNKWMNVVVAHAIFMLIAWALIFPSGAIIIRFFANKIPMPVKVHWVIQLTGVIIAILGMFLGLGASQGQIHFFHQTFGLLLVLLLLPQIVLGWWHHRTYDPKFNTRRLVTHSHLWIGRGGLGLNLFGTTAGFQAFYYITLLGFTGTYIFVYFRQQKRNFKREMDSFLPPFEPTDDDDLINDAEAYPENLYKTVGIDSEEQISGNYGRNYLASLRTSSTILPTAPYSSSYVLETMPEPPPKISTVPPQSDQASSRRARMGPREMH